jgi:hypothetical protein
MGRPSSLAEVFQRGHGLRARWTSPGAQVAIGVSMARVVVAGLVSGHTLAHGRPDVVARTVEHGVLGDVLGEDG